MKLPEETTSIETLVLFAQFQDIKKQIKDLKNCVVGCTLILITLIIALKFVG